MARTCPEEGLKPCEAQGHLKGVQSRKGGRLGQASGRDSRREETAEARKRHAEVSEGWGSQEAEHVSEGGGGTDPMANPINRRRVEGARPPGLMSTRPPAIFTGQFRETCDPDFKEFNTSGLVRTCKEGAGHPPGTRGGSGVQPVGLPETVRVREASFRMRTPG